MTVWTARVLTIFPDMFPGPLGHSLAGRALADGKWGLEAIDIRNFTTDTHRSVDDSPFGGGPGMVMRADVLDTALESVAEEPGPVIYLTPAWQTIRSAGSGGNCSWTGRNASMRPV